MHGLRRGDHGQGRAQGLPVLPGGDALQGAPDLQRGLGRAVEHQGSRGAQARRPGAPSAEPVRAVPGSAQGATRARGNRLRHHRDLHRLQRAGQDRADPAAHPQRRAPADRGVHADGQRLRGRLPRALQASGAVPHPRGPERGKTQESAGVPAHVRPVTGRRRQAAGIGLRRGDGQDQVPPGRGDAPDHAAALDAAGGLQPRQHRPLRSRV
ncbi:hypothetical protein D3C81_1063650 [compost metagenome]